MLAGCDKGDVYANFAVAESLQRRLDPPSHFVPETKSLPPHLNDSSTPEHFQYCDDDSYFFFALEFVLDSLQIRHLRFLKRTEN